MIGRVQGLCLAGGVGLAIGCDVLIASDAAAFGMPEMDRGLWPFMVSGLLARHISPKVAMDLMLSGRRMPAAEAHAVGLTSRVVPAADSMRSSRSCGRARGEAPGRHAMGKAAYAAAQETALARRCRHAGPAVPADTDRGRRRGRRRFLREAHAALDREVGVAEEVRAEMVGNVMKVVAAPGDTLAAGDTLVLLESMKMEIPVITEDGGVVRTIA